MRMLTFSGRTAKEIMRDPLNIIFGLGFPIVLILLLSAIQANVPVDLFKIDSLTPGITVFGLSFMTLFAATLIAKDRESAFLQRLYTTPMAAADFILGYMLPVLPIALAQSIVCYIAAVILGLDITVTIVYAILFVIPVSLFFIALGLLCGSVFTVKQVGGICGALLIPFMPESMGKLCIRKDRKHASVRACGRDGKGRAQRQLCGYLTSYMVGACICCSSRCCRRAAFPQADEKPVNAALRYMWSSGIS